MNIFNIVVGKEATKRLNSEIFKPYLFGVLIGLGASIVITVVAAAILGFNAQNGSYSFSLNQSDGWIIFTIFVAMSIVISVISYYRI